MRSMKFLIVEPSPVPIRISLGPKYSPQDPVFACILPLLQEIMLHNHITQLLNSSGEDEKKVFGLNNSMDIIGINYS